MSGYALSWMFSSAPSTPARATAVRGLLAACVLAAVPATARGNGAFPDSQTVLVPDDRPDEIVLVTNFGLVISEDGGTSWQWSCERDENAFGLFYQLGPPPRRRLFTAAAKGLAYTDDGSCGWAIAGGTLATQAVIDFFPSALDANRVLAIGIASATYAVFPSTDGGTTFGPALYTASNGDAITGVEISRSDPNTIYVAMNTSADTRPKLARSTDGGAHFTEHDLMTDLGAGLLRIVAVDPQDPATVWLRWLAPETQAIAVTRDGGQTASKPLPIAGTFTSFVRLPNGTLLVGAVIDSGTATALYRSHDGGATFDAVPNQPKIRGLVQRSGVVYAATDNFGDGYALGVSTDEGTSWRGIMAYDQIQAIVPCLRGNATCQATCNGLAGLGDMSPGMIWDVKVCSATPPLTGAGGSGGAAGSAGLSGSAGAAGVGGRGGSAGGSPAGAAGGTPRTGGCGGCGVAPGEPDTRAGVLFLLAMAALTLRRARRLTSARDAPTSDSWRSWRSCGSRRAMYLAPRTPRRPETAGWRRRRSCP